MKLHQPLFSAVIILIQLIITIVSYINFQSWLKSQDSLICSFGWTGDELFFAVLILALFEMTSNIEWVKSIIQTLLALIIFVQIGPNDIRNDFYELMEVTAFVSAFISILFFLSQYIRLRYK